ncbi:hypothetical protein N0V84_010093 [Fusarium piperis]|uniref:Uncharacterized protein n=1 Tax=Fusarium piperis TaxID=1435070 RepID=A0A9W9BIW5_9HYPO|nr:hypothetical protein N0V84_010093 [Fusarium piperis]
MSTSQEQHGSKHLRYAIRRQEFRQLCTMQRRLDKLYKITEFDNDALARISITRGSAFNIDDDDDPIDLDPRFFLPSLIENMEYEPINNHLIRKES